MLISRLCPVNHHRFHFPCAGTPGAPVSLNGPLAVTLRLKQGLSILWKNKRCLTRITTPSMSEVLFVEIGSSGMITVYEPGKVSWDADLIDYGKAGVRPMPGWGRVRGHVRHPQRSGGNESSQSLGHLFRGIV